MLRQTSPEECFDPNAFGMATLLGGLCILGIASNLMIDGSQDDIAYVLGYLGLASLIASAVSFLYSFAASCLQEEEETPLLRHPLRQTQIV